MRAVTVLPVLTALAAMGACSRSGDRPAAPSERPVVVPYAPPAGSSAETSEALPERDPITRERDEPELGDPDDGDDDLEVAVQRDGGVWSFSAKTVRDGGFSFRFSGSVSVTTDGGSINLTISPDAGAP